MIDLRTPFINEAVEYIGQLERADALVEVLARCRYIVRRVGPEVARVVIPGPPQPKQRPKFNTRTGRAYTPKETRAWEKHAERIIQDELALRGHSGPLRCEVHAVKARRKADKAPGRIIRTVTPDGDNVLKIAQDALQLAGIVTQDQVISQGEYFSWYAAVNEAPHVEIILRELP